MVGSESVGSDGFEEGGELWMTGSEGGLVNNMKEALYPGLGQRLE